MSDEPVEPSEQARIILQRSGGIWKDRIRNYSVRLDGVRVGTLGEYDTFRLHIDPGEHELQLKIDFLGSRKLTANFRAGETKHFVCAAGKLREFPKVRGYVKLWEGELTEVLPPALHPPRA